MNRPRRPLFGVLCVRADAGRQAGTGHVMRCLALAQAWLGRGGKVVWGMVMVPETAALVARLEAEQVTVVAIQAAPASAADALETGRLAQAAAAEWVVVDGYHFSGDYRAQLKHTGVRILLLDDLADGEPGPADVILNQNLYARPEMYAGKSGGGRLLLGPAYALLRREFLVQERHPRIFPARAGRVLVTFGGADPGNATLQAMRLLAAVGGGRLQVTIVAGAANPHLAELRAAIPGLAAVHDVELVVNPPDLPELMRRADLVISAAGSSCLELAFLGAPTALSVIAENQRLVADRLVALDAAEKLALGEPSPADVGVVSALLASAARREHLSRAMAGLVDEWGAARVVEALATHPLELRLAQAADARLLWEWANDPDTRAASFHSAPIPWEAHLSWYHHRLQEPEKTVFFIGNIASNEAIGVVRFELNDGIATISVNLASQARGRGWGGRLIRLGAVRALTGLRCREVRGWVKTTNVASLGAFQRAGFRWHGRGTVQGVESVEFRLSRADLAPVFPGPNAASP